MIFIYPIDEMPGTVRITFEHGPEVFSLARDYYHRHKDMRCHKAVVYKDGAPGYCLGWTKNKSVNVVKNASRGHMNISNYWEYAVEDEGLDYSFTDRFELIIYERLEEYSYHTARLIRKHDPKLVLAFLDADAGLFFDESETLLIAGSEEELFERRPDLKGLRTLRAGTKLLWDLPSYFTGRVPSITIMTSLYWLKREFCYGPMNPDKTFYLIKQPVKENGITAQETLEKTAQYVKEQSFDYVYLATEDQEIFELFQNSELRSKLLYVDQERVDYRREENAGLLLHEIFARDGSDPYSRTLDYIAVLDGLTRCQALLANVTCGAVTYALARRPAYEFVDVRKIGDGNR